MTTLPIGFDVPFRLYLEGNSPNTVEGTDALDRSIRTIIRTFPGERVYRPTFGSPAQYGLFESVTQVNAIRIGTGIRRAIEEWEPRVVVQNVGIELDDNTIYLTVVWRPVGVEEDQSTTIPLPR